MQERSEQPPEGKLIEAAADRMNLSLREAAARAGISYGRWRQIVKGYQNVSPGSYAAVRAPAKTLARMAAVVGVTPGQLEESGRPDAAGILREMATPHDWDADRSDEVLPDPASREDEEIPGVASMLATPGIDAYLTALDAERGQPGWEPANADELRIWLDPRMNDRTRRALVAFRRLVWDQAVRSRDSNASLWRSKCASL